MTVKADWMTWPATADGEFGSHVLDLEAPEDVAAFVAAIDDPAADVAQLTHLERSYEQVVLNGESYRQYDHDVFVIVKDGYGYLSFQDADVGKQYSLGEPTSPGGEYDDEGFPAGTGLLLDRLTAALTEFLTTARQPQNIEWLPVSALKSNR